MQPVQPPALQEQLLQQLQGRKLRIARPGEMLTMDVQAGRVTIYLDQNHRICDIKIEPDKLDSV